MAIARLIFSIVSPPRPASGGGDAAEDKHQGANQRGRGPGLRGVDGAHRLRAGDGADAAHQRHGKEQADQRQHRQMQPGKAAA